MTLAIDTYDGASTQPLVLVTQGAQLGDTVWFDSNQDGAQDSDEFGIGGVTVELYRNFYNFQDLNGDFDYNDEGEMTFSEAKLVGITTTYANGYYEFKGLAAGVEYFVQFTSPGTGFEVSPQ